METKIYIFSLDYGNRMEEKEFIKAVLREFDSNTLVGCGIFVNNNPYCLELLFFASLEKDTDRFEDFMKKHFNDKQRVFNYFFDDIIESFRFLYKGIIIKHNKTEPTYTKTSLFLCEKRRFLWPGLRKEGNLFKLAGPGGLAFFHLTKKEVSKWPMKK